MILHELLSFELLRLIWWLLIGILLIGFAMTDGFDMGTAVLLPFVARTDVERRVVIHTVGPVWEGNQVWFILGGGAIFAAWPPIYAISFSGFYLAMFLILAALIVRPVAFKFRDKRTDPTWRARWDRALFLTGLVPALLFGVAVGNVILGVPFRLTDDLHAIYQGGAFGKLFGLFRPFALLCGLTSVAVLITHGAGWLMLKTDGLVQSRARAIGTIAAVVAMAGYGLAGLWLALGIDGFAFVSKSAHDGPSNPLVTEVLHQGTWLQAYLTRPWIILAPAAGFLGLFMAMRALQSLSRDTTVLLWSKLAIFGMISSVGLMMFPFILPSNLDPRSSLTVWYASSSHLTLFIMLFASAIFLPVILTYTAWVYRIL